ncbi:MAG: hypothetical protein LBQ31_02435 [Bacteroidales bacterium]|jgi:hypothetical protein|nr:hypothetical protein [Bacteroidales bacterium]
MKKITTLIVSVFTLFCSAYSQTGEEQNPDSVIFAFPDLTRGTVVLKDGSKTKTLVNYNYYNQNFLYKDQTTGQILKLDNLKDVAYVEVGRRYFIPVLTGLGELIVYDDICLVYSKKVNVEAKKEGAYGTASSTSSISNVSNIEGTNNSGSSQGTLGTSVSSGIASPVAGVNYSASINDKLFGGQVKISLDERLFLSPNPLIEGKTKIIPLTKKNLLKIFPTKTALINSYFEEHNPDLENLDQAKILVIFCNEK